MRTLEDKITLIDEICKQLHPAQGIKKGWGYYTGGMSDTGGWHFRTMLDVPYDDLVDFLEDTVTRQEELNTPSNKPPETLEDIECRIWFEGYNK